LAEKLMAFLYVFFNEGRCECESGVH